MSDAQYPLSVSGANDCHYQRTSTTSSSSSSKKSSKPSTAAVFLYIPDDAAYAESPSHHWKATWEAAKEKCYFTNVADKTVKVWKLPDYRETPPVADTKRPSKKKGTAVAVKRSKKVSAEKGSKKKETSASQHAASSDRSALDAFGLSAAADGAHRLDDDERNPLLEEFSLRRRRSRSDSSSSSSSAHSSRSRSGSSSSSSKGSEDSHSSFPPTRHAPAPATHRPEPILLPLNETNGGGAGRGVYDDALEALLFGPTNPTTTASSSSNETAMMTMMMSGRNSAADSPVPSSRSMYAAAYASSSNDTSPPPPHSPTPTNYRHPQTAAASPSARLSSHHALETDPHYDDDEEHPTATSTSNNNNNSDVDRRPYGSYNVRSGGPTYSSSERDDDDDHDDAARLGAAAASVLTEDEDDARDQLYREEAEDWDMLDYERAADYDAVEFAVSTRTAATTAQSPSRTLMSQNGYDENVSPLRDGDANDNNTNTVSIATGDEAIVAEKKERFDAVVSELSPLILENAQSYERREAAVVEELGQLLLQQAIASQQQQQATEQPPPHQSHSAAAAATPSEGVTSSRPYEIKTAESIMKQLLDDNEEWRSSSNNIEEKEETALERLLSSTADDRDDDGSSDRPNSALSTARPSFAELEPEQQRHQQPAVPAALQIGEQEALIALSKRRMSVPFSPHGPSSTTTAESCPDDTSPPPPTTTTNWFVHHGSQHNDRGPGAASVVAPTNRRKRTATFVDCNDDDGTAAAPPPPTAAAPPLHSFGGPAKMDDRLNLPGVDMLESPMSLSTSATSTCHPDPLAEEAGGPQSPRFGRLRRARDSFAIAKDKTAHQQYIHEHEHDEHARRYFQPNGEEGEGSSSFASTAAGAGRATATRQRQTHFLINGEGRAEDEEAEEPSSPVVQSPRYGKLRRARDSFAIAKDKDAHQKYIHDHEDDEDAHRHYHHHSESPEEDDPAAHERQRAARSTAHPELLQYDPHLTYTAAQASLASHEHHHEHNETAPVVQEEGGRQVPSTPPSPFGSRTTAFRDCKDSFAIAKDPNAHREFVHSNVQSMTRLSKLERAELEEKWKRNIEAAMAPRPLEDPKTIGRHEHPLLPTSVASESTIAAQQFDPPSSFSAASNRHQYVAGLQRAADPPSTSSSAPVTMSLSSPSPSHSLFATSLEFQSEMDRILATARSMIQQQQQQQGLLLGSVSPTSLPPSGANHESFVKEQARLNAAATARLEHLMQELLVRDSMHLLQTAADEKLVHSAAAALALQDLLQQFHRTRPVLVAVEDNQIELKKDMSQTLTFNVPAPSLRDHRVGRPQRVEDRTQQGGGGAEEYEVHLAKIRRLITSAEDEERQEMEEEQRRRAAAANKGRQVSSSLSPSSLSPLRSPLREGAGTDEWTSMEDLRAVAAVPLAPRSPPNRKTTPFSPPTHKPLPEHVLRRTMIGAGVPLQTPAWPSDLGPRPSAAAAAAALRLSPTNGFQSHLTHAVHDKRLRAATSHQQAASPAQYVSSSSSPRPATPTQSRTPKSNNKPSQHQRSPSLLMWDTKRSGNVLISKSGTMTMADASRARVAWREESRKRQILEIAASSSGNRRPPHQAEAVFPMFALGTLGVSQGDFVFEVQFEAQQGAELLPHSASRGAAAATAVRRAPSQPFAVGFSTKYFCGPQRPSPAFLYRSDGALLAQSDEVDGVPFGPPLHANAVVTCHVSFSRGEIGFYVDGEWRGVAFRFPLQKDAEPLFPLVVFTREGDACAFQPPSVAFERLLPSHYHNEYNHGVQVEGLARKLAY